MNESCHSYELVMSQSWMRHARYQQVISHFWMSPTTYENSTCHACEWLMAPTWNEAQTYRWVTSLICIRKKERKKRHVASIDQIQIRYKQIMPVALYNSPCISIQRIFPRQLYVSLSTSWSGRSFLVWCQGLWFLVHLCHCLASSRYLVNGTSSRYLEKGMRIRFFSQSRLGVFGTVKPSKNSEGEHALCA